MENIIIPVITLLIGWLISSVSKRFENSRQDKKKLKRLLFNLLEFRFTFTRSLNFEKSFDSIIEIYLKEIEKIAGEKVPFELGEQISNAVKQAIQKADFFKQKEVFSGVANIKSIVEDLSEINPLLAYRINIHDKIEASLNSMDNYFQVVESTADKPTQFEVKDFVKPKVQEEILDQLDQGLSAISLEISKKTKKEVQDIILDQDDFSDFQEYMKNVTADILQTIIQKIKEKEL